MRRSAMRRCLKGLGGFPTSTDGFILGPSHGTVGRLDFFVYSCGADTPVRQLLILIFLARAILLLNWFSSESLDFRI